ncbi:PH domain-containing protein, partial [Porcipelethomonas sp.]|uniref:PH domain-containing protein n=1 Tax=Porcipelethomonas sp. TaxID=2981675 RepID=UPI003EF0EDEB
TLLFQSGRIAKDLIENELDEFFRLANSLSARLALKIPPAAIILGFIAIATWLLSFIANMLRYSGFVMKKDRNQLKIKMGAVTRRMYHIIPDKINYVDMRQSLIMKIFHTSSVNISCSGYGNQKNELPVLLPILTWQQANRALDLLDFKKYITKRKVKADKKAVMAYAGIPLTFIILIAAASFLTSRFLPSIYDIVLFVAIMAEIPFVWLLVVKIAALFTSGITIENDFCCIRYSRFYAFHTILADKEKLVKVQIIQNPVDKKLGRCRMDFYFNAETPKSNKIKGIRIQDAKKIIEKFEFS